MFPSFVSQQAAIKVTHLDDFPSPVPGNTNAAIEKTYNRTIKEFFKEIWWRDMKRIADEQDVTYTGFLIGSYKNTTEETTEDLAEKIRTPMLNYGRGLLKMGGEIVRDYPSVQFKAGAYAAGKTLTVLPKSQSRYFGRRRPRPHW